MRWFEFKRVDRLVAMAVLTAVGLAWAVIVTLDAFRIFIIELNDVGQGTYTLTKAVTYVLLTVPRRVYEMFGYAGLIGGLMGLGGLANSGELTALRAAGLSKLRICASVALALAILTAGVAVLGETLGPYGERKAQALSLVAKSKDIALAKGGSLWARDGEAVVGVRRARTHNGQVELGGLRVFEFDDSGRLKGFSLADNAVHEQGDWMVHNLRHTVFGAENTTSTVTPQTIWHSGLDPRMLALGIIATQYMPLRDLDRNIQYLDRNHQDASSYRNAYWARVFYPFNVLVLVFCAVPFAFGTLRSGGLSKRLFIGIVVALGFQLLQSAIVNFGAINGIHPALANMFPPLILIGAALLYFRRHA
jgi:lipopolysaccharide export system permease protein